MNTKKSLDEIVREKYTYNYLKKILKNKVNELEDKEMSYIYKETINDIVNVINDTFCFFLSIKKRIEMFSIELENFIKEVRTRKMYLLDSIVLDQKNDINFFIQKVDRFYKTFENIIYGDKYKNGLFEDKIYDFLSVHRYLLSCFASTITRLEWQTISLESSKREEIFQKEEFDYKGILGYKRVHYPKLIEFEKTFLSEFFEVSDNSELICLFTNSGQAAFATLRETIFSMLLKGKGSILLSPNGYYETSSLVSGLKSFSCKYFSQNNENAILKQVKSEKPDVLILEPYYCENSISLLDINSILSKLDAFSLKKDLYIIIDASMLSGAIQPYATKIENPHIHIFLMESCIKYREFGMDKVNAGFLISHKKFLGKLITARARIGAILNNIELETFPRISKMQHDMRMKTITRNSLYICNELEKMLKDRHYSLFAGIEYPGSLMHPDYPKFSKYIYMNGILNVKFDPSYYKNFATMLHFIKKVIEAAQKNNISVNHGTSFGFDWTRLAVADASGGDFIKPFIRISVGRENLKDIVIFTHIMKQCITRYLTY